MERLTYKAPDSEMVWFKEKERLFEPCEMSAHQSRLAIAKLAAYEDAEEHGLLLLLPFKAGDKIYKISENFIEPCTVETIFVSDYVDKDGNHCNIAEIHYSRYDCPYTSDEIYFTDIGKTVFLTEEEAEAKLAEMEGEE